MARSLLLPLSLLAARGARAQTASPGFWGQEAADAFRTSSLRVTTPSAVQQVIFHDLGDHPQRTRGTWPTLPVLTPAGKVIMASTSNAMMQFEAPHTVTPDVDPGDGSFFESWHKTREFSPSTDIGILNYPAPSSSAVVDASGVAYWVNREQSMLFSWDTTSPTANKQLWPKINLTDRTATKDGFWSYYSDFSILLYGDAIHLPDPNYHAALTVQASSGTSVYSDASVLGLGNHRLLGSCGSTGGAMGTSTVFTDFGTQGAAGDNYGVYSLDFDGSEVWRGNVKYDPADGDFMHPTHLEFSFEQTKCDVGVVWETSSGVRISGMDSDYGTSCGEWTTNEEGGDDGTYLIADINLENSKWATGPAVIFDDDDLGYWLYILVNLQRPANATQFCTLLGVFVSNAKVHADTGEFTTVRMPNTNCNAAPVALLDLWGPGQHGVSVLLDNGTLAFFDSDYFNPAKRAGSGGYPRSQPRSAFSLWPYLPGGSLPVDTRPDYSFVGNYMAATTAGSIVLVVHERGYPNPTHALLVAVVGGHLGAPPVPSPAGPAAAAAAASSSSAVAAAFGGIGGVAALCGLVLFFAPASKAAGLIRAGAGAVAAAGRAAWGLVSGGHGASYKPPSSFGGARAPAGDGASLLKQGGGYGAAASSL